MFLKTVLQSKRWPDYWRTTISSYLLESKTFSILFRTQSYLVCSILSGCDDIVLYTNTFDFTVLIIFVESVIMLLFKLGTAHFAPGLFVDKFGRNISIKYLFNK